MPLEGARCSEEAAEGPVTDSELSPQRHQRRRKAKVRLRRAFAPNDDHLELPSRLFRRPTLFAGHGA